MMKRCIPCLGILLAGLILAWALPLVSAEDLGQRRVQRMNGSWLVGQVEELPDVYKIKTATGITVTLKKSEVKNILPLEGAYAGGPVSPGVAVEANPYRRYVSDEEIAELLADIVIERDDIIDSAANIGDELPLDEDSLEEMLRLAGTTKEEGVLLKPHFVLVYTTSKEAAMKLAARVESVYRWNIKFMRMLKLPLTRPEYKLEVYYFASQQEFDNYTTNVGGTPRLGILGYYRPDINRSHFFDLATFPPIARLLEIMQDTRIPYKQRQRARNILNRWVAFNNLSVTQHEVGHHIHFNIGLFPRDVFIDPESYDSLPRWLVEGTTMMFEFPPTKAGASLGTTNHGRLDEFDKIYGRHNEHRRLSPQRLKSFILDNNIFLRGGGSTYSLGWAMVHYFWKKQRDGYAEYMRIISQREPGFNISYTDREKEFEDCFGRVDEDWINEWYEFLDSLHLKRSVLPPDLRP